MRLVFPTDENMGYLSKRGAHFGKANFYTVITIENEKIVDVEGIPNPGHSGGACGNAVTNIMGLNPDALIVSGQESIKMFITGDLEKSSGNGTCKAH